MKQGYRYACCAIILALVLTVAARAGAAVGVIDKYVSHAIALVDDNLKIRPEWSALPLEVTVRVNLNKLGGITGISILKTSGSQGFDQAVFAAITKARGFGVPPFTLYAVGLRISSRRDYFQ